MKPVDEEMELARLLAEEGSPLGASAALLRARGPDPSELASLASRLSLRGIDVTGPAEAPRAAPKPWKKWLIAGGGGAAAGLAWLALQEPAAPRQNEARGTAERARALEMSRHQRAPEAASLQGGGGSGASPSMALPTPASAPARDEPAPPEPAPTSELPVATSAPTSVSEHAETPPRAVGSSQPSAATRASSPFSPPAAGSGDASPSDAILPSEIELLRDARLALRQSPSAALALAEQHARLYPQGKLSQERELIAISALVASGRRTAALSRGARFEQAFPTSPYRKQLGELLK